MQNIRSNLVIYVSFFIALVLSIFPLPFFLSTFRPEWVLLSLFYWTLALPHKIGGFHALILGILLDLLLGSTIGLHAITLPIVTYAVAVNFQMIRYFSIAKTAILVGLCVFLNKLFLYFIASTQQDIVLHTAYFYGVISSMILWPWFFLFMRSIRLKFKVKL